jgi:hypothetical protein
MMQQMYAPRIYFDGVNRMRSCQILVVEIGAIGV